MAKADVWMTDDNLIRIRGWARDGMTDEQIAGKMGIGVRTLYEWKKKYPQFSQALKSGKEVVDYAVENALLKKALAGDVGACCFWLKNRRPDKWKDKQDGKKEDNELPDDGLREQMEKAAAAICTGTDDSDMLPESDEREESG